MALQVWDGVVTGLGEVGTGWIRLLGALALLPLGEGLRGTSLKCGIALILALLLTDTSRPPDGTRISLGYEFLIGLVMSLPVALLAEFCANAGELFDLGRGQSIGALYDPWSAASSPVAAVLLRSGFWVVFLGSGMFVEYLACIAESINRFPPDIDRIKAGESSVKLFVLLGDSLNSLFLFFLPIGAAFALIELTSALLVRSVPQLLGQGEIFGLKSLFGAAVCLWLLQYGIPGRLSEYIGHSLRLVSLLLFG